jgi:hypothetical protein
MSLELHDVRAKVSPLGYCALIAFKRANDVDVSEIIRDIVEAWAQRQVHSATLLASCMKAKGIAAADAGTSGNSLKWEDE